MGLRACRPQGPSLHGLRRHRNHQPQLHRHGALGAHETGPVPRPAAHSLELRPAAQGLLPGTREGGEPSDATLPTAHITQEVFVLLSHPGPLPQDAGVQVSTPSAGASPFPGPSLLGTQPPGRQPQEGRGGCPLLSLTHPRAWNSMGTGEGLAVLPCGCDLKGFLNRTS